MARKSKLTPELIAQVSEYIRQGSYDFIACERVGISQSTFYLWLQQAELEGAEPLLLEFSESVEQARAEARSRAEIAVMADKPETWLLKGPGRERPGRPGWTSESTINVNADRKEFVVKWDGNTDDADHDPAAQAAPGPSADQG